MLFLFFSQKQHSSENDKNRRRTGDQTGLDRTRATQSFVQHSQCERSADQFQHNDDTDRSPQMLHFGHVVEEKRERKNSRENVAVEEKLVRSDKRQRRFDNRQCSTPGKGVYQHQENCKSSRRLTDFGHAFSVAGVCSVWLPSYHAIIRE